MLLRSSWRHKTKNQHKIKIFNVVLILFLLIQLWVGWWWASRPETWNIFHTQIRGRIPVSGGLSNNTHYYLLSAFLAPGHSEKYSSRKFRWNPSVNLFRPRPWSPNFSCPVPSQTSHFWCCRTDFFSVEAECRTWTLAVVPRPEKWSLLIFAAAVVVDVVVETS